LIAGTGAVPLMGGYGANVVADAWKTRTVAGGPVSITLPDDMRIAFDGLTSLNAKNFATGR
jgi:hypothetical protein